MTKFNSLSMSCGICKKNFLAQPSRVRMGRGKYCSPKCYFVSKKGKISWNKGLPAPWATGKNNHGWIGGKPKCIECGAQCFNYDAKFCKKCAHKGNRSFYWKGQNVSYSGLHIWVKKELGSPNKCEFCGKLENDNRKIHWANKSGKYKRVLSDWLRLCVYCHSAYDRR